MAASQSTADASDFSRHLRRAADTARKVFSRHAEHALDEQAGPAYLQGLPLSRWIFWRRLRAVQRLLQERGGDCLDFGCGFGLLLPYLSRRFDTVRGVDLMPELAAEFLQQWNADFGENCDNIRIVESLESAQCADGSLDLILALDVLEHVDDLPQLLDHMARLLKPTGRLIVTGPTENWVYKLGRKIVGFSGDYHVRSIHDITQAMRKRFHVQIVGRIGFPATLFHVVTADVLE